MNKLHDPELELFKRTVDLADYAKRAGYELRPQDGAPGLTVLDHPNRDRIVVGQHPNGPWVYASVPDYALRAPGEPADAGACTPPRARSIARRTRGPSSSSCSSAIRWARRGDGAARPGPRSLAQLSSHGSAPRLRGCPLSTAVPARSRAGRRTGPRCRCPSGGSGGPKSELNRRRYDWSPPVENGPRETEVERRLREWREAQAAIDRRQRAAREVQPPAPPAPQPAPLRKGPWPIDSRPPARRSRRHRPSVRANRSSGVDATTGPRRRRASTRSFAGLAARLGGESDEDGRAAPHVGRRRAAASRASLRHPVRPRRGERSVRSRASSPARSSRTRSGAGGAGASSSSVRSRSTTPSRSPCQASARAFNSSWSCTRQDASGSCEACSRTSLARAGIRRRCPTPSTRASAPCLEAGCRVTRSCPRFCRRTAPSQSERGRRTGSTPCARRQRAGRSDDLAPRPRPRAQGRREHRARHEPRATPGSTATSLPPLPRGT